MYAAYYLFNSHVKRTLTCKGKAKARALVIKACKVKKDFANLQGQPYTTQTDLFERPLSEFCLLRYLHICGLYTFYPSLKSKKQNAMHYRNIEITLLIATQV